MISLFSAADESEYGVLTNTKGRRGSSCIIVERWVGRVAVGRGEQRVRER